MIPVLHRQPPDWHFDSEFEGSELGCGVLLLDLQAHFRRLPAGSRVRVLTLDAGAPRELPAWCRLTKNHFLESAPPFYLLSKGELPASES